MSTESILLIIVIVIGLLVSNILSWKDGFVTGKIDGIRTALKELGLAKENEEINP